MKFGVPFAIIYISAAFLPLLQAQSYYVDPRNGDDGGPGTHDAPFKTVAKAVAMVDGKGGEINLTPEGGPYRDSIIFHKGGTPDNPIILDGHGSVVNLGLDVTAGPWTKTDEGYVLEGPVQPADLLVRADSRKIPADAPAGTRPVQENTRFYLATPVYINGLSVVSDHVQPSTAPRAWHGGYIVRYDDQGRLVIAFPKGLTPENSVVVLTGGANYMSCGVQCMNANNVTIRNITSVFAPNDGFNCHGSCQNIRMEHITALFNGDQGISSHETCQVEVDDSEVAFNGTNDGSIEDVQQAVTTYRNLRVHQNRSLAFLFQQGHHILDRVVSWENGKSNLPQPSEYTELTNCQDLGQIGADTQIPVIADANATPDPSVQVQETDRLGRFLQVRPPATTPSF